MNDELHRLVEELHDHTSFDDEVLVGHVVRRLVSASVPFLFHRPSIGIWEIHTPMNRGVSRIVDEEMRELYK